MRKLAFTLTAALVAGLGSFAPAFAPAALASVQPKVAIIVGATHGATASYRADADEIYNEALKYTTNVVRVYSPNATWSRVKSAVNGASIIVYLGHGNGWPSPYTYDPGYATKDGFGLNYDNNGDGKLSDYENKYYGEPSIGSLTPAPNAVVLLFHLCYASGNSEPGNADPSPSVARQRADNYAAAFLKAGARAVIANGHSHNPYYIDALFTTHQTIEEYWRNAPDFHNHVVTSASSRSPGYTVKQDPESTGSYYRSLVGKLSLTTQQVTGASYASTSGDPSSFVVPGNASPKADGAPVYGSPEDAAQLAGPIATVNTDARVRIEDPQWGTAIDGSPVFKVHIDGGPEGWMTGSTLVPRDIMAPRVWETDEGSGVLSPNGDGVQDSWDVSVTLSEPSSWTLRVLDGEGATVATKGGSGATAAMTWAPGAGSVVDGTYAWTLEATDAWGNGPLTWDGQVLVDTSAPTVTVADADAPGIPVFTPNGDGSRETIAFSIGSSEPGVVLGTAVDGTDSVVDSFSTSVGSAAATLSWDGRSADGYLPDGRYTVSVRARDRAGNVSDPQTRVVDLYGSLGFLTASKPVFYPQDNDALARSTGLVFRLASSATVSWRIVNGDGATVRTFLTDQALEAGTLSQGWDGRNDDGAFVPRGTYRSYVSATNGVQAATQAVTVVVDAFRVVASDATPGRGQKVTMTATSAEALGAIPVLAVYQPGISGWSAKMTKVSNGIYRVTVLLRSSSSGTVRFKVLGLDSGGNTQWSNLYLPLH
ncbi:MAG: FlgD immunoglobulin-like domain containing protein [Candidatus Limnocylindrales bacterium]